LPTSEAQINPDKGGRFNNLGNWDGQYSKEPTRRVIEIQSDLFQKGRLEDSLNTYPGASEGTNAARIGAQNAKDGLPKLEPYRNTWHERLIREEVKQAAKDGKTKLQFPTGETAMKIEGLGQSANFRIEVPEKNGTGIMRDYPELTTGNMKVGQEIFDNGRNNWIITDVLGDGKFKAVPKNRVENMVEDAGFAYDSMPAKYWLDEIAYKKSDLYKNAVNDMETFDISGTTDQNNPIYKFYEKEVGKYLKNKYGAQLITDSQGVKWWEVNVNKALAKAPVEAFGAGAGVQTDDKGNIKFNPVYAVLGALGVHAGKNAPQLIDKLIAAGKVRVVSRSGRDVYQIKKGSEWVSVRDEDSALKQLEPKEPQHLPEDVLAAKEHLSFLAENLDNMPGKRLIKYTSNGKLPEVARDGASKFAKEGDTKIQEALGYEGLPGVEEGQKAVDDYIEARKAFDQAKQDYRDLRTQYREGLTQPAAQSETATPALRPAAPKATPALASMSEGEARSLQTVATQLEEQANLGGRAGNVSLEAIVKQTPVENKVNILDYIRTPDRVLKKIGLEKEASLLRTQYDGYLKELPKNLDVVTGWVERVGKGASGRIFKYLDGQAVDLVPKEKEVALEIRAWLSQWADRLGLPDDNRVTNYITHLFDDQLVKKEFDEDLAKIISDKVPGEVYNPFLEKRLGAKGYKQDAWSALDAYAKRATRKVYMDTALEQLEHASGKLEESAWDYVKKYADGINMRPTKVDNLLDNAVKSVIGYRLGARPTLQTTRFLRQMTYRAFLGLNPASALRNLSQGVNTYATLGEKYTAIGYTKLFSPSARKELETEGIFNNSFIQDRSVSAAKKAIQRMDKGLFVFFDSVEKINRGAAYLGAKAKALKAGKTEEEAVEYAKKIVRRTQFAYDSIDTPVGMNSDIVKTLLQFNTYTVKQTEFLIELRKDKTLAQAVAAYMRYGLAGAAFVGTIGAAFGMELKELLPSPRFGTPASLKLPVEVGKAALDTPDQYGRKRTLKQKVKDVKNAAIGLVPAGSQIKKTYQGVQSINKGGSFDAANRLQFKQGTTPAQKAQSIVFGKYAGRSAKAYFKKKEAAPKPKATSNTDLFSSFR
jgi:hypothetical protein